MTRLGRAEGVQMRGTTGARAGLVVAGHRGARQYRRPRAPPVANLVPQQHHSRREPHGRQLAIRVFVVVGLHIVRAMPTSGPSAPVAEPVDPPTVPTSERKQRKSGRKRGVSTGFDRETAREQARRLCQLRREGTTWAEAARTVGLTEDQAKNVYRRFDDLMADDDGG